MESTAYEFNFNRYAEIIASELGCTIERGRSLLKQGSVLTPTDDVEEIADVIILRHIQNI